MEHGKDNRIEDESAEPADKPTQDKPDPRRAIGFHGEDLAAQHLEDQGWEIVARNYELKIGEIDLVAARDETVGSRTERRLAFVEVKTRRTRNGPPPEAAVHIRKRKRLVRLARVFLQKEKLRRVNVRFDVIAVDLSQTDPQITHFEGAFDADGAIC